MVTIALADVDQLDIAFKERRLPEPVPPEMMIFRREREAIFSTLAMFSETFRCLAMSRA